MIFLSLASMTNLTAQDQDYSDSLEVFLIDSYVSIEKPYKINISFFTSDSAKSSIILPGLGEIKVSSESSDYHELKMDISEYRADSSLIKYKIKVVDRNNIEFVYDDFEAELPQTLLKDQAGYDIVSSLCIGSLIFALPSVGIVFDGEEYVSFSKEIPILSKYDVGYNYPQYYFALEYTHILKYNIKNLMTTKFNYVFTVGGIEYISPGLGYVTNFSGQNGLSTELSVGLFKVFDSFTFFTKFKNSYFFSSGNQNYTEISIGLYSNVFSFSL